MKKILHLLIGISYFCVNSENQRNVINSANKNNIFLLGNYSKNNRIEFKIYSKDEKKFFSILADEGIEFFITKRIGVTRIFKKYKHRTGVLAGLLLLMVSLYISPLFVWEINISGIEKLSEEYVSSVLSDEGVCIGAFHPLVDRKAVYMNTISKHPDISWISVNFIGSSANVEIIERDYTEIAKISADATNIVATKSGQISDLNVLSGECLVKKGDIVKEGDILISGVYDTGMSGTKYVNSSGEVYAIVTDNYNIEVPLKVKEKEYINEFVVERELNIFGKSIKIYKNYSHLDKNYDTIQREQDLIKTDAKVLPISSFTTVAMIYSEKENEYCEEDALNEARNRFFEIIDTNTNYRDILSYEESYEIKNNILFYSAEVDAIENIAMTSRINIE